MWQISPEGTGLPQEPNFEFFNPRLRVNSANTPLASVSKSEDRTNLTFFLYYVLVPDKDLVLNKMSLPLNVICVTYQRSSVKKKTYQKSWPVCGRVVTVPKNLPVCCKFFCNSGKW
jgi:hypothetical protein